jgi:hypothetical protein
MPKQGRYCRSCDTRLGRDNTDALCAACQRHVDAMRREPPAVPDEFWDTGPMRVALTSWHIGRVIRVYRHHPFHGQPIPQQTACRWLGLTQSNLSRLENGPAVTDLTRLIAWSVALRIPPDRLWFQLPGPVDRTASYPGHA